MKKSPQNLPSGYQDFIDELSGFAKAAEETLSKIEKDMEKNKGEFSFFSEKMLTIRGTALQLGLPHVAHIAGLGEEIAVKGVVAQTRPQIRKCIGSLWDAMTTIKHLIINHDQETAEEQQILVNRLESTLKAFGGARETASADDIEALIRARG